MKQTTVSIVTALCVVSLPSCCLQTPEAKKGAALGAAIGAAAGAVIGNQQGKALEGAGIGLALGGVVGASYGCHVAFKKEKFNSEVDYLNACIAEAHSENAKYGQEIAEMQQTRANLLARRSTLSSQQYANSVSNYNRLADLRAQGVDLSIDAHKKALAQTADSNEKAQLQQEVSALQAKKSQLQQLIVG